MQQVVGAASFAACRTRLGHKHPASGRGLFFDEWKPVPKPGKPVCVFVRDLCAATATTIVSNPSGLRAACCLGIEAWGTEMWMKLSLRSLPIQSSLRKASKMPGVWSADWLAASFTRLFSLLSWSVVGWGLGVKANTKQCSRGFCGESWTNNARKYASRSGFFCCRKAFCSARCRTSTRTSCGFDWKTAVWPLVGR